MKIYVARHGQTAWNALNKTCGTTDLPLNELGLQQAEELADKVEHLGIDLIISSTLIRAQQTAAAVSRRIGVPVITDSRIVEQNYGIYEGKDRKDPGFLENKRHFAYRYPGGGENISIEQVNCCLRFLAPKARTFPRGCCRAQRIFK